MKFKDGNTNNFAFNNLELIKYFEDDMSIVDFKTSRKLKEERYIESYFLQASCYAMMANERLGTAINQLAIIIAVDHEEPQIVVKRVSDYMKKVIDIFRS